MDSLVRLNLFSVGVMKASTTLIGNGCLYKVNNAISSVSNYNPLNLYSANSYTPLSRNLDFVTCNDRNLRLDTNILYCHGL